MVERVRRALHVRRVGHTGTLDPLATGVLPIVVGRATRLASLLATGGKCYEAIIRLGVVTDTYDVTGRVLRESPPPSAQRAWTEGGEPDRLNDVRRCFLGTFRQNPPPFSAKKVGGVRAYRLARRQSAVAVRPVEVTVHELELWPIDQTRLGCRVTCSPGFYVRALAHDLGERLGSGACLEALRRERSGAFGLDRAVSLPVLEAEGPAALGRLMPLGALLPELPGLVLTSRGARRAAHGNLVSPDDVAAASPPAPGGVPSVAVPLGHPGGTLAASGALEHSRSPRVKLFDAEGMLVAIAEPTRERLLHPTIVLV